MRRLFTILAVLLGLAPASAQQQVNLANFPSSSVVGRLGSNVNGPAQAISFTTLLAQLNSVNTVVTGPATTTVGDIATWGNIGGTSALDSGVKLTGSGTVAMGSANTVTFSASPTFSGSGTLNVASGKTLTDTSGAGAVLLLGSTGGGFTGYAGVTCSTGALTALSAAGGKTCSAAKAATNSTVASPTAPSSTSVFQTQGLAGAITPAVTGNILVTISGYIGCGTNTSAGNGIAYQIYWGTGTAPGNNQAVTGNCGATSCTAVGSIPEYTDNTTGSSGDINTPFSASVVITGLTVGTAVWLDLAAKALSNANTCSFNQINIAAVEI